MLVEPLFVPPASAQKPTVVDGIGVSLTRKPDVSPIPGQMRLLGPPINSVATSFRLTFAPVSGTLSGTVHW